MFCVSSGDFARAQATPAPIFRFQADGFWLNLHHFLYVLGRAEAKMPDSQRRAVANAPGEQEAGLAALTEAERQTWREAVSIYASGLSRKDAVFDKEMFSVTNALVTATGSPGMAVLDRAAPIYLKAWWPQHQRANRAREAELQALLSQHGAAVLAYITRAYQESWPADGFPVNLSGYANWAGAYSTAPNLLVVSSQDEGTQGLLALEIIFHEAMHQWDDPIFEKLRAAARRAGVARIPGGLTHAMIFYTAGEAVRSVVPSQVPYAEANGMWASGGFAPFKARLDQAWRPYLAGKGTLDEALEGLLR
ncbi:MAG: hypothetical protein ABI665_20940 [Vicinamibacterales bacterium]